MPKVAPKKRDLVMRYARDFPNETFRSDSNILYCDACDKAVSTTQRFQVTQHIGTAIHIANKQRKTTTVQQFITSSPSNKSTFNSDLCTALIKADIPLRKIDNINFRQFLEKYISNNIPDSSTLRKNYLPDLYENTLINIRKNISSGPIWVSMDETTDVEGRYVGNIIVGKLNSDYASKPYLLNTEVLEKCNHSTVARFVNDSLGILWPNGILHERVLLFISDAAPYMVKAGTALHVFYPKLVHVTCLAHAFHRVAETIRSEFSEVDFLISTIKKIFLKAPSRVNVFKENYPQIPLLPEPVITRWGTWLQAAAYYCDNFSVIEDVISKLEIDAVSVENAKNLIKSTSLKNNLVYISSNTTFLANSITKLEAQNLSLADSLGIVSNTVKKLKEAPGEVGIKIKKKVEQVLSKNPDLKTIEAIANIHNGSDTQTSLQFSVAELGAFKFAPITSVDVERSFSRYKNILRPNRCRFTFDNLKKYMVVNCFVDEEVDSNSNE